MIRLFRSGASEELSDHFSSSEFDCPCPCGLTYVDERLVSLLEVLRAKLQRPISITSGYRCSSYQKELAKKGFETSLKQSQHETGCAADIFVLGLSGPELEKEVREVGFKAVGVASNWIHVDVRDDKDRKWAYVKRSAIV